MPLRPVDVSFIESYGLGVMDGWTVIKNHRSSKSNLEANIITHIYFSLVMKAFKHK